MAKIDRVKIAVLGTGSIGLRHLRIINSTENATAVAIPVRANRLSELKADGYATVPCLREAAGEAQAIIIATDTVRHPRRCSLCPVPRVSCFGRKANGRRCDPGKSSLR